MIFRLLFLLSLSCGCYAQTQVVVLGSGNPNPDPVHSGCSLAIVVDETPYIVDFGPGVVRQASTLSPEYGGSIEGLRAKRIKRAFLTHLHSDHTVGYPDLILTPWTAGRDEPLQVYGPEGTERLTAKILEGYEADIRYRVYGLEETNDQGWRVHVSEIEEGVIYEDELVTVEAFLVNHGTWPNAYGFRFTTPDKVIVISGDTAPCETLLKFAEGADILLHEVYSQAGFERRSEVWQSYHAQHHTSTHELADIANICKPGLVVLYHILYWGATDQEILQEITSTYDGRVIMGADLMVID